MAEAPMQSPAPSPEQGAPQGGFMGLVSNVFKQLGMIQDVLAKANVNPEVAQQFAALQDQFQSAVESLQGGGQPAPQQAKNPEGSTSPEAGAAEVVPM